MPATRMVMGKSFRVADASTFLSQDMGPGAGPRRALRAAVAPRCYDPRAMAETADAIVIGAGIMGAATAYHLARRKYGRVVVLERDGICSGSTALTSGGIRHQYANRIGIELTQRSIVVYENFAAEFGVDPQFRQHGYLILQQTEEERRIYSESAATQRAMGVDTRVLGPDEIRAGWPYLRA